MDDPIPQSRLQERKAKKSQRGRPEPLKVSTQRGKASSSAANETLAVETNAESKRDGRSVGANNSAASAAGWFQNGGSRAAGQPCTTRGHKVTLTCLSRQSRLGIYIYINSDFLSGSSASRSKRRGQEKEKEVFFFKRC